jgi:peptidoglycan hydrolase-like protein with peptidoglycan-binding domain
VKYTRVLKFGSSGDDVFYIKKCLFSLKYYPSTITAITKKTFGNDTVKAVLKFQNENKDNTGKQLVADGKVGPLTWGAIVREYQKFISTTQPIYTAPVLNGLLKVGSRGEEVRVVQLRLNQLGFNCGTVDGIFGSKTKAAVKAFQTKNGLVVDGIVGSKTIAKLFEVPAPAPVSLLNDYTHISKAKRDLIEKDLAGVSETRKKIVLEILRWCHDHDAGGEPRALYIIGANLYNTNKEIFYPTKEYIEKRAAARPSYFTGGRKEFMLAQIAKNPKLPAADCSGMEVGYMRKFGIQTFDATANSLCSSAHSVSISKSALKPGDWVGRDGHIGTYVGGGYVVEFYGGAYTCALTALNKRTAYNFITKKLSTGSNWTKFRRPKYY